jgi:hypothetical protein
MMVNEHKGKEFQAADEQVVDVARQYAGLSGSRANEAAEMEPADIFSGHPRPGPFADVSESLAPAEPPHEVFAAVALEPGQLPQSDHWPGQLLPPPADDAGDPETDVGGDSDSEPSPEDSSPGFAKSEKPMVQGSGANFEDFHRQSVFELLEAQETLSPSEFRLDDETDGFGSNGSNAPLTLTPAKAAPVSVDDSVLTNIVDGSAVTVPIAALLVNDSDANGDLLTGFTVVDGSASGGSAVVDAGNVVFTPDPGAFSAGAFSYTVSDGMLTSSPALVTIAAAGGDTITDGPDPAVLLGDDVALILSTIGNAKLGGLTFGDDDLVEYDPAADSAALAFDGGALFAATNEDIDAVHVLSNGHIVLSTVGNATLGGLTFGDDDLVDYDPVSDTASLLFDGGALFSNAREDINAAHVLSNGHIVLSTVGNARLGGLTFGDDDLVEYDPVSDTASLFFDGGALFSNTSEDINAAHVLSNGHIVLSTVGNATLGGLTFGDDDLVEYDPVNDTASLFFDGGALFSNTAEDINAAGLSGSDVLAGGAGNDWLNGGVGSDSLDAGAGEDTLVWDAEDRMIDGGSGIDTLRVASGNVDLPTFTGAIAGIERIDLTSDAGANSVTLTARDVLDISDTDIVTLLGDSTDSIAAGTGWTDGGVDSSGNHIYSQMVGPSLATLLVDPDMLVNPDILT